MSTTVKKNNTKLVSVVEEISNTLWNMNHMVPVDHVGLFHYCSSSDSADSGGDVIALVSGSNGASGPSKWTKVS